LDNVVSKETGASSAADGWTYQRTRLGVAAPSDGPKRLTGTT
jgi:thiamine pyrophosphate-dependent acetolactate synthase large subunit-like protein